MSPSAKSEQAALRPGRNALSVAVLALAALLAVGFVAAAQVIGIAP